MCLDITFRRIILKDATCDNLVRQCVLAKELSEHDVYMNRFGYLARVLENKGDGGMVRGEGHHDLRS